MIEIKQKPCKAMGKAVGFIGCDTMSFKRVYGLCPSCYANWLLSTPEGQKKLQKSVLSVTKPRRDLEEQMKTEKESRSLSSLLNNVKNSCHDYIKLRDRGLPCVSCNQPWNSEHQAGHFYKAELYSNLKYDEFNIHNQCVGCNIHKDGNHQKYREVISSRIGREGLDRLDKLAAEFKTMGDFKWDREELVKIRKYFKDKTRELRNSLDL